MNDFFGKLLVASPKLDNTPFGRSVVYVIQDNEDATIGVMLNRPADNKVEQAWRGKFGSRSQNEVLSIGGPIAGPIVAIHRDQSAAEIALPNGLFAAATEDNLQLLANQNEDPFQVFFGLSGWQKGELMEEVKSGNWIATHASDKLFFCHSDNLWRDALRYQQSRFVKEVLGIRNIPRNILDN